jgi:nucleoside-triphosphatase THEP1
MFDAQCDLAALVYEEHEDPDAVLREFAAKLNARGLRAVGMVQAGACADSSLSAVMVHSGEMLLLARDFDPNAKGCSLDLGRLQSAGERVADAMADGADLVIVNRFGKREQNGKGLGHLIDKALGADIPVVIAVGSHRFDDWIKFVGGMTVKLPCQREALDSWWPAISARQPKPAAGHETFCEMK